MKKTYILSALLGGLFVQAQQLSAVFQKVENTPFEQFHFPSAAVLDVDNDGFMDIVYTGSVDTNGNNEQDESKTMYYKNINGVFQAGVPLQIPVSGSKIIAFDRNNDGFTDIITVGRTFKVMYSDYQQIYKNNNGEGFVLESSNLPGKKTGSCSIDFADLDHDGVLDYALNGELGWRAGFDFYPSSLGLTGVDGTGYGDFKFVDLNNDAEMDIVTIGQESKSPYNTYVKVYLKKGNTYELTKTFTGIDRGTIAVADFDADGNMDFAVNGQLADFNKILNIYFNKGQGIDFEEKENNYGGLSVINGGTSLIAGDLNNDGYADLVSTGEFKDGSLSVGTTEVLYYIPQERIFSKPSGSEPFIGIGSSSDVQLLDYNNDGKLDILLSGLDNKIQGAPASTALYQNTTPNENQKPTPPTHFELKNEADKLVFSWSGATDDKTPTEGLSYEISIGTESGKADIAKYKVTTNHWFLDKAKLNQVLGKTINANEIFWSVKSIDAGHIISDASEGQQLSISEIKSQSTLRIYPNPATHYVNISGEDVLSVQLLNANGQMIPTKMEDKKINVSHLPKGVYFLQIKTKNSTESKKFIKQ